MHVNIVHVHIKRNGIRTQYIVRRHCHAQWCHNNRRRLDLFYLQALNDLIVAMNWQSFTIIYENNDRLMQITNILKSPPSSYPIRIRQLSLGPNYR